MSGGGVFLSDGRLIAIMVRSTMAEFKINGVVYPIVRAVRVDHILRQLLAH
jgi:hypothetical protein